MRAGVVLVLSAFLLSLAGPALAHRDRDYAYPPVPESPSTSCSLSRVHDLDPDTGRRTPRDDYTAFGFLWQPTTTVRYHLEGAPSFTVRASGGEFLQELSLPRPPRGGFCTGRDRSGKRVRVPVELLDIGTAQPTRPTQRCSVSPRYPYPGPVGQTVRFRGSGFEPNTTHTVWHFQANPPPEAHPGYEVRTDRRGRINATFTLTFWSHSLAIVGYCWVPLDGGTEQQMREEGILASGHGSPYTSLPSLATASMLVLAMWVITVLRRS